MIDSSIIYLEISIERSVKKSISLKLLPPRKLLVRAPYSIPDQEIRDVIQSKRQWINKNLERLNCSQPLIEEDESGITKAFYLGNPLPIVRDLKKGFLRKEEVLHLEEQSNGTKERKLVFSWLKKEATSFLSKRFKERVSRLPKHAAKPNGLILRLYRSRWGCCNNNKVISLNTRLIQLPTFIIDYVIDHELAHCTYLNHSQSFYTLLQEINVLSKRYKREIQKYLLN
jgi:predicted metal-dependent hydrolase